MLKSHSSKQQIFKLPRICSNAQNRIKMQSNRTEHLETIDQKENDMMQVTKLDDWSMSKPNKKAKTNVNTHSISFLYNNPEIRKQVKQHPAPKNHKFLDIQMYIEKLDNELQKIRKLNYFSINKNLEYCSGVYENSFNGLLKSIAKYKQTVQKEVHQIQSKLQQERKEHLKKVHQMQSNLQYKTLIDQVRQQLQRKQQTIKLLKRMLKSLDLARIKILKYCLSLGYNIKDQGLIWVIKQLGVIPKYEEFPQFLSQKQIKYIITKYTNQYQVSHAEIKMKVEINGKTINQAYQQVNRRKRREFFLINQNQEIIKIYAQRIKDYCPQKHNYLNQETLQIAQSLQKDKPKPTRYEIIYKQAAKKLNKICKQKIHPQIYGGKNNKQNKKGCKIDTIKLDCKERSIQKAKYTFQTQRRNSRRNSSVVVEQFTKMLNLSINQTKKLDQLYTKQQKDFQDILRQIRLDKYNQPIKNKAIISKFQQRVEEQPKLRNPISILGCLVGWRKAQKVIQQQMLGF